MTCLVVLPQNGTIPTVNVTTGNGVTTTPGWYILAGMGFSLFSSLAVSLGTILQKKAHLVDLAKPPEQRAKRSGGILCTPLWLLGFLMMALLQIPLSFAALALAPQSIVIPLGAGATIVFTQILAFGVLKEKMGKLEAFATLVIVGGIVLTTTANGGKESTPLSACGILKRYTDVDFVVPILLMFACLFAALLALKYNKVRPGLQPAIYGFIAGSMGAGLNILLKVVGEFTQGALAGDVEARSAWSTIHPYVSLVGVLVLAVGMVSFINQGLERFNAGLFLPLYNCQFVVLTTLLGALFFREFDSFGPGAVTLFVLGFSTTIFGIALISCAPQEHKVAGEEGWEGEMARFEQGAPRRARGPSDPQEPNYWDADLDVTWDDTPQTVKRLVLI